MGHVVLVTGAARNLGRRFSALIAAQSGVDRVIAVDVVPPAEPIDGVDFVRADIRNPVIAKVMAEADVDTVVHLGVIATPRQAGGRATMKEINVIGSMQLLAACQRTTSLRHLVVKSSAGVYGSGPKDPGMFTEDMDPRHAPRSGWAKDSAEVESYVRGFARRRPDVEVTTLRFANIIDATLHTAFTEYFTLPVIPTVLGFDPRLQFVHADDALEMLRRSVVDPHRGTFNVAGPGVITLQQAVRRTGRPQLPVPQVLLAPIGRNLSRFGLLDFSSEQVRHITYGRVLDTTLVTSTFGFTPQYSSAEAFEAFLRGSKVPSHA